MAFNTITSIGKMLSSLFGDSAAEAAGADGGTGKKTAGGASTNGAGRVTPAGGVAPGGVRRQRPDVSGGRVTGGGGAGGVRTAPVGSRVPGGSILGGGNSGVRTAPIGSGRSTVLGGTRPGSPVRTARRRSILS